MGTRLHLGWRIILKEGKDLVAALGHVHHLLGSELLPFAIQKKSIKSVRGLSFSSHASWLIGGCNSWVWLVEVVRDKVRWEDHAFVSGSNVLIYSLDGNEFAFAIVRGHAGFGLICCPGCCDLIGGSSSFVEWLVSSEVLAIVLSGVVFDCWEHLVKGSSMTSISRAGCLVSVLLNLHRFRIIYWAQAGQLKSRYK